MRRLAALVPLLLPVPAEAQAPDAFCAGLRQLAAAAAQGFDAMPRDGRRLPGSIEERRGIARAADGLPRAAFFAVMLRDTSGQRPSPVQARFHALSGEIARCLPHAEAMPVVEGQGGAYATWTMQQALIGLRRDDGDGGASAEVEVSVAGRW